MIALQECPFCHAAPEATTWNVGNFGDREAGVICRSCGVTHGEAVDFWATENEITVAIDRHVAAWNCRHDATRTQIVSALQLARNYVVNAHEATEDDSTAFLIQCDLEVIDKQLAHQTRE
jgi:hypothetical protein